MLVAQIPPGQTTPLPSEVLEDKLYQFMVGCLLICHFVFGALRWSFSSFINPHELFYVCKIYDFESSNVQRHVLISTMLSHTGASGLATLRLWPLYMNSSCDILSFLQHKNGNAVIKFISLRHVTHVCDNNGILCGTPITLKLFCLNNYIQ